MKTNFFISLATIILFNNMAISQPMTCAELITYRDVTLYNKYNKQIKLIHDPTESQRQMILKQISILNGYTTQNNWLAVFSTLKAVSDAVMIADGVITTAKVTYQASLSYYRVWNAIDKGANIFEVLTSETIKEATWKLIQIEATNAIPVLNKVKQTIENVDNFNEFFAAKAVILQQLNQAEKSLLNINLKLKSASNQNVTLLNNVNYITQYLNEECKALPSTSGLKNSNVMKNSATMSWNSVSGAIKYEFILSKNSSFSPAIFQKLDHTGTSINIGSLTPSATYYWKVRAKSSKMYGGWSSYTLVTPAYKSTNPNSENDEMLLLGAGTIPKEVIFNEDIVIEDESTLLLQNERITNEDIIPFPNPIMAGEELQIDGSSEATAVSIYSLEGQLVVNKIFSDENQWKIKIPTDLPAAIYMIKVTTKSGDILFKKLAVTITN